MKKIFTQFIVSFALVSGLWFGLSMLPWVKWFKADEFSTKRKKELSEVFLKLHRLEKHELYNDSAMVIMNTVRDRLCIANHIDTTDIHLHIFRDYEVNAYAIPGGHIIVNSALVRYCDNPDMLAGVISHEIGHIEKGHFSKRFFKEVGLSIVMMFGGEHLGIFKELVRSFSSNKFDRSQECEADDAAIQYMQHTHINTKPLADFFDKMSQTHGDMDGMLEWASTHPNSKSRAKRIRESNRCLNDIPTLNDTEWKILKNVCQ
ncbi:MAG: M48 family metallopeptidase [Bacteroidetes bacterium]|nr:M48 family metallopeptidase [Bacteroidota bacterium]